MHVIAMTLVTLFFCVRENQLSLSHFFFSYSAFSDYSHPNKSMIGVVNSNPLQYSCLENSTDRRTWWATVHGIVELHTSEHTQSVMED